MAKIQNALDKVGLPLACAIGAILGAVIFLNF